MQGNKDNNGASTVIEMAGISKTYRLGKVGVVALRNVDLKISHGEFISIMGPSGSGKSTLMNIMGCLDVPDHGRYLLDNTDVSKLNDNQLADIRNKKIGFVFQTFNLLSRSSAVENVELPLIYSKVKFTGSRKSKILSSLNSVGLTGWEKHKPSELSGGQRQRVAIARALVNDPAIIFADEPTGNLDSVTGEEIMAIFQKLNNAGKTILIVTHEMDIARHTNRVIYLRDGMVFKEEKIENPVNASEKLKTMPKLEDNLVN